MALFVGIRDVSFMRSVNREVISDIVDSQVDVYKVNSEYTKTNLYGEADDKVYYMPIRLHAIVSRQEQQYKGDDQQDYDIQCEFRFLRDDLVDYEYYPQVGDIVSFNGEYYEMDTIIENQYIGGRNPEWAYSGNQWGWNVSIVVNTHVTRRNIVTIDDIRSGVDKPETDLPSMI